MNLPLETFLAQLTRQLRFLPPCEREQTLTEVRAHLEERIAAYLAQGESPHQAFVSAQAKWGEFAPFVRATRAQWWRHHRLTLFLQALLPWPLSLLGSWYGYQFGFRWFAPSGRVSGPWATILIVVLVSLIPLVTILPPLLSGLRFGYQHPRRFGPFTLGLLTGGVSCVALVALGACAVYGSRNWTACMSTTLAALGVGTTVGLLGFWSGTRLRRRALRQRSR